jgi:hypothetical protein
MIGFPADGYGTRRPTTNIADPSGLSTILFGKRATASPVAPVGK